VGAGHFFIIKLWLLDFPVIILEHIERLGNQSLGYELSATLLLTTQGCISRSTKRGASGSSWST
jgi:hypothetical protein